LSLKDTLKQAGIAIVSAAASVACFKTGYFIFLFLLPLALSAFYDEAKTAWASTIFAAALNIGILAWFYLYLDADLVLLQWNALYYTVMVFVFTWINVPFGKSRLFGEIPFRMILGASFCILAFLPFFFIMINNSELQLIISRQLEAIGSLSSNTEAAGLAPEEIISGMAYLAVRGGIPLSCLLFWWVNRQFGLLICRFFRRGRTIQADRLLGFRVPFFLVWILSFSLGAVLLGRIGNIDILDIAGWNILILSAILFLVQGGAILMHFLMRFPPLPRILINIGIIILLFRPGINAVMLCIIVLLGIMENWVPFRAPKQQ
jgi:hypothetical protein